MKQEWGFIFLYEFAICYEKVNQSWVEVCAQLSHTRHTPRSDVRSVIKVPNNF